MSDGVTDDALQAKVSCEIERRRRTLVVDPTSTELAEGLHVATDVFVTQLQLVACQTQLSLPDSRRQLCMRHSQRTLYVQLAVAWRDGGIVKAPAPRPAGLYAVQRGREFDSDRHHDMHSQTFHC